MVKECQKSIKLFSIISNKFHTWPTKYNFFPRIIRIPSLFWPPCIHKLLHWHEFTSHLTLKTEAWAIEDCLGERIYLSYICLCRKELLKILGTMWTVTKIMLMKSVEYKLSWINVLYGILMPVVEENKWHVRLLQNIKVVYLGLNNWNV
jgi:hypothetical protein